MKKFVISERLTDEEYFNKVLKKSDSKGSVIAAKNGITSFDRFTKNVYDIDHRKMIDELYADYQKNHNSCGATAKLLAEFFYWQLEDHDDIIIKSGRKLATEKPIRAILSGTAHGVVNQVRYYLRAVGGIKITAEDLRDVLTVPIQQREEDPEPMTLDQIIKIVDSTTKYARKIKYLVIRDTAMRSSESMQFTKKMITFNILDTEYAKIRLSQKIVKGKSKARVNFLSPDVAKKLQELSKDLKDDDPIFWTLLGKDNDGSELDLLTVNRNEAAAMDRDRKRLAEKFPEFGAKYEHNGFHKISLHAIRAFTATAISKGNSNNEDLGHGYIGHKKYLDQYIRKTEAEQLEIFKNAIPYLTGIVKEYDDSELAQEVKEGKSQIALLARQLAELKKNGLSKSGPVINTTGNYDKLVLELAKRYDIPLDEIVQIKMQLQKESIPNSV